MPRSRCSAGTAAWPAMPANATRSSPSSTRAPRQRPMTIRWVLSDPLVMNGEPFCYGTRLTVRNILELRQSGVAAAYAYAAANKPRYAEFFEADGSLVGPGYSEAEADGLPSQYRLRGVVIKS